jgi:hypothetical protein
LVYIPSSYTLVHVPQFTYLVYRYETVPPHQRGITVCTLPTVKVVRTDSDINVAGGLWVGEMLAGLWEIGRLVGW